MQISFDPPLRTVTTIRVTCVDPERAEAILVFSAALSNNDLEELKRDDARIQVWSNLPSKERASSEWGADTFELVDQTVPEIGSSLSDDVLRLFPTQLDDSLQEQRSETVLKARFAISRSLNPEDSFQYTYRIVYPDGGISWQGEGEGSNGTIQVISGIGPLIQDLDDSWNDSEGGARVRQVDWQIHGTSLNIGRLIGSLSWKGWVMTEEGPVTFELPSLPPPKSSFIVLLPSYPQEDYTEYHSSPSSHLLHASPSVDIIIEPNGELNLECATDSLNSQVYFRPLDPEFITQLFKLAAKMDSSSNARAILPQSSTTHVAFLSQGDPIVRRVDIMPLQSSGSKGKASIIKFDGNAIDDVFPGHSSACAFSAEANAGKVIKFSSVTEKTELRVELLPEGGSFLLSPLFSAATEEDERSVPEWSIAPLSRRIQPRAPRRVRFVTVSKHSPAAEENPFPSNAGTIMASVAYIAILITVLLSYIAPSTSATLRSQLPTSKSGSQRSRDEEKEKGDRDDMAIEDRQSETGLEEESDNSDLGESRSASVSFDLSKVAPEEDCTFALLCQLEVLAGLILSLGKEAVEVPLTRVGKGASKDLWLVEVASGEGRSRFRVRNRT